MTDRRDGVNLGTVGRFVRGFLFGVFLSYMIGWTYYAVAMRATAPALTLILALCGIVWLKRVARRAIPDEQRVDNAAGRAGMTWALCIMLIKMGLTLIGVIE